MRMRARREIVQKNDEQNLYKTRTRHVQMDHINTHILHVGVWVGDGSVYGVLHTLSVLYWSTVHPQQQCLHTLAAFSMETEQTK